jgi:tetratricopeptide (TPR) repeat protein
MRDPAPSTWVRSWVTASFPPRESPVSASVRALARAIAARHSGAAKFAAAADYFRKCVSTPDGGRRALCLESLGECLESLGQYRQSMATLHEAIEAAIASNNRGVHAAALGGMGDVYMRLH